MSLDAQIGERLTEERKRLGLSQQRIADLVGIRREMWAKYEAGAEPGAAVLGRAANAGIDVSYVITGRRDYTPPPPLSTDDQRVLQLFKLASPGVRRAALALLATGELPTAAPAAPRRAEVVFKGLVGQQIHGDITAPQTFHMGDVVAAPAGPAAVKRVRKPRVDR